MKKTSKKRKVKAVKKTVKKKSKRFSAWDHPEEGWTTIYHCDGWKVIDGVNKNGR